MGTNTAGIKVEEESEGTSQICCAWPHQHGSPLIYHHHHHLYLKIKKKTKIKEISKCIVVSYVLIGFFCCINATQIFLVPNLPTLRFSQQKLITTRIVKLFFFLLYTCIFPVKSSDKEIVNRMWLFRGCLIATLF